MVWDNLQLSMTIPMINNTGFTCRQHNHMHKPRKKQKIEADASTRHDAKPKFVKLEALPWNQVNLPDRLEDAEGFFGLEEISDVEVVRDKYLGRVEYRVGEAPQDAPSHRSFANFPRYLAQLFVVLSMRRII